MITQIRHTGIVVSDLGRSLRFYRDLLGFEVKKEALESGAYIENMLALPGVKVTTVKMVAPEGGMVELLHFQVPGATPPQEKPRANQIGVTHFAATVKDLDAVYRKLVEAGTEFNAPPQLSPDGYAKVTFCRDPDGSLIELVEVLAK